MADEQDPAESQGTPPEDDQPSGESAGAPESGASGIEGAGSEARGAASPSDDGGMSAADAAAMAEQLLASVSSAVRDANDAVSSSAPPPGASSMALPSFDPAPRRALQAELDLISEVNLNVKIELGRTRMLVDDVLKLGAGAVVELDKLAGDPVDIFVNDRHVARGEVLVLNDNFCVRVSEIIDPEEQKTL